MALNKVEKTQLKKFGSLTVSAHKQQAKSIFGNDACKTVCSYKDSFNEFSVNGSAYDIFSKEGKMKLQNEIAIMTGQNKPQTTSSKNFEMNQKSFMVFKQELEKNKTTRDNLSFSS